jgi:hypothetical protein
VSNDPQSVFDGLLRERGGSQAFDQTQLAVARKLAQLLADDGEVSGSTITTLVSLLPPKPSDTEVPYDLSKLSDKEFSELDRLTAIAAGLKPSKPDKPRRHPQRSYRQIWGEIYAIDIDQIEAEQEHARRRKQPWPLSDGDRLIIANACGLWMGLLALPAQVWPDMIESAIHAERKRWLDKEAAALAAAAAAPAVPAVAPAPAPAPSTNVVPMLGLFSSPRRVSGEARVGVDIERGIW